MKYVIELNKIEELRKVLKELMKNKVKDHFDVEVYALDEKTPGKVKLMEEEWENL